MSDRNRGGGDRPNQPKCPICGRPSEQKVHPFCSRRCADVDLSRWMTGVYAIPVAGDDDDEDGDGNPGGKKPSPGSEPA